VPYLRDSDGEWPATSEYRDTTPIPPGARATPGIPVELLGDCAEFDDGNGLWINSGVSRDLSTDLTEGVPRRATAERLFNRPTGQNTSPREHRHREDRSTADNQQQRATDPIFASVLRLRQQALPPASDIRLWGDLASLLLDEER